MLRNLSPYSKDNALLLLEQDTLIILKHRQKYSSSFEVHIASLCILIEKSLHVSKSIQD